MVKTAIKSEVKYDDDDSREEKDASSSVDDSKDVDNMQLQQPCHLQWQYPQAKNTDQRRRSTPSTAEDAA